MKISFLFFSLWLPSLVLAESSLIVSAKKGTQAQVDMNWVRAQSGVITVEPLFAPHEAHYLTKIKASHLASSMRIRLKTAISARRLKQMIEMKNWPLDVESDNMDIKPQTASSDPLSDLQWALGNKGAAQPLDLDQLIVYKVPGRVGEDIHMSSTQGTKEVVVAVLDTGIDKTHPDISKSIVRKESECTALEKFTQCLKDSDRKTCEAKWFDLKNPEVDQDKNGYPLDCQGWSILGGVNGARIMGRPDFSDDMGHGTHVAGIIGALSNNSYGINAFGPNIKILPVQVLGNNPSEPIKPQSTDPNEDINQFPTGDNLGNYVARGVVYAMINKAQVINFSMGWPQSQDSELLRKLIEEAQAQGIIVVAAAGNDSTHALLRPCAYKNVICVGAHGPDGAFSHFSNFGTGVDLLAPGVNILSLYPMGKRSIRFKQQNGYEYLSGTSQATPYVSAAAAYLLSLNIPPSEVYPRLVSGTRDIQEPLQILVQKENKIQPQDLSKTYTKYALAGNLDIQKAVSLPAQPLIVPASKERAIVNWGLEPSLNLSFSLVNKWQAIKMNQVKVSVTFQKNHPGVERPKVVSLNYAPAVDWNSGEEKTFTVNAQLTSSVSSTRIPSDLNLIVKVETPQGTKKYVLEYDVLRTIQPTSLASNERVLDIQNMPTDWYSIIPFDGIMDGRREFVDYLGINYENNQVSMYLISQDKNINPQNASYKASSIIQIKDMENLENVTEQVLNRMDIDGDGQMDYVVGLLTDNSNEEEVKASPMRFFVFDEKFTLKDSFTYNSEKAQIPRVFSWVKDGKRLVPIWLGMGYDPNKKLSLIDLWENPKQIEKPQVRLYYIGADQKLKTIAAPDKYGIIDVLQIDETAQNKGEAQVLLAKAKDNVGYLYDFAVGAIKEGKIENVHSIVTHGTYTNILEARVGEILSLEMENNGFAGTFWFTDSGFKKLGLSMYDSETQEMWQYDLSALREKSDAPLWVRSSYMSDESSAAFVFTNSEMQFHDISNDQVIARSLERYTFNPDLAVTNFHYPSVIRDALNNKKLPVLYTAEMSEMSKGIKFIVPNYDSQGNLIELLSPARLRMQAAQGCRPMDVPVVHKLATELDYICQSKIVRMELKF